MNQVSPEKMAQFKKWVEEDWPNDPMLQEIHLIRLVRQEEQRGMSDLEIVEYYRTVPKRKTKDDAAA